MPAGYIRLWHYDGIANMTENHLILLCREHSTTAKGVSLCPRLLIETREMFDPSGGNVGQGRGSRGLKRTFDSE